MLTVVPSSPSGAAGPRPQDMQKLRELVNKFVVNTVHLMNTFAATCEDRLAVAARQLHRVECQVTLLEYKLDSIDRDSDDDGASPKGAVSSPARIAGGPGGADAPAAITAGPGRPGVNLPVPKRGAQAPPMPAAGKRGAPPPPGSGGPPLPPGAVAPAGPVAPPPPIAPGAPPLLGAPPPPPPMPTTAGLTVRTHPKLAGYFRMQQAGVAVVAIKAKMRADGFKEEWFDTPDMPSPLPAVKADENVFDSD